MADQTFRNESAQSAKDQAFSAGRDMKEKAKEMAGSSSEALKERASDLVDAAKGVAAQASDKLQQAVEGQKNAGAEYVGTLADTMRRAAREFDNDLPIAGTYIRKAASQVEMVSDSIRNGNFNDLMQGAQSFARRQPTAFLGMAVLAGFGLVRFLKSSAEGANDSGPDWGRADRGNAMTGSGAGQQGYGYGRQFAEQQGYGDEITR